MRKSSTPGAKSARPRNPPPSPRIPDAHPAPPDPPLDRRPERTRKAQFLEPYRLSAEGRSALLERLAHDSIGDGDSRELFAAAVEYGIASCRASPKASAAPSTTTGSAVPPSDISTTRLRALAASARGLSAALSDLPEPERAALATHLRRSDPFDRPHDRAYLEALIRELTRVADAAEAAPVPVAVPNAPALARPRVPEAGDAVGRRLLLRVCAAYEACFDRTIASIPGSDAVAILRLIAGDAAIPLPTSDEEILAWLPSSGARTR